MLAVKNSRKPRHPFADTRNHDRQAVEAAAGELARLN